MTILLYTLAVVGLAEAAQIVGRMRDYLPIGRHIYGVAMGTWAVWLLVMG